MATSSEYGLGEFAFPRGWFAIANSAEIERKPLNVHYFGQDMVLYRGESGRVVMLDAYCPHMGTHLGKCQGSATVLSDTFLEGDAIRCPFHAWRFNADGVCDDIPYYDGAIPEKARVKSWQVEERWGIVFCWHDPENGAPEFPLPELPEWNDPQWVRWKDMDYVGDLQHGIEVFDNMSDAPHLEHLHGGGKVLAYENEVDGHLYHQRETMTQTDGTSDDDQSTAILMTQRETLKTMTTVGAYHGPGLMLARFIEARGIQLLCTTPVDDGTCTVRSVAMMKSPTANQAPDKDEQVRAYYASMLVDGLRKDGEVWANKKPALRILQLPADGPFGRGRRWYSQFFNPRAKAGEILKNVSGVHPVRGIPVWSTSDFANMDTV